MQDRWYEDKWYKVYYFIPNALLCNYVRRSRSSLLEDIPTLNTEAKLIHAGNCSNEPVVFQTKEKLLLVLSPAQIVCMLPLKDKEKE